MSGGISLGTFRPVPRPGPPLVELAMPPEVKMDFAFVLGCQSPELGEGGVLGGAGRGLGVER